MTKRLTIDYPNIINRKPVNMLAVQTTVNRGVHYIEPTADQFHWQNPPKIIPIDKIIHKRGQDLARRIIGYRFGRLTVVGLFQERITYKGKTTPGLWAVRCACGHYEVRHMQIIMDPNNKNDMCYNCSYLETIKNRYKHSDRKLKREF